MAEGKSAPAHLSSFEKVRATIMKELPFVFPFTARAEMFLQLVHEDRRIAQVNSSFNTGPMIAVRARRPYLYEDAFEKLSIENGGHWDRVRSFWSRSLRSGTLRSQSFGSEAKFSHFGRGHYGPGHFGRGHFCLYFRHYITVDI